MFVVPLLTVWLSDLGWLGEENNRLLAPLVKVGQVLQVPAIAASVAAAICMIVGITVGIRTVPIFLEDGPDRRFRPRRESDIRRALDIPVLGSIPKLRKGRIPKHALDDVRSSLAEAYYSLRVQLLRHIENSDDNIILVTSGTFAEGKSTTAFALARQLAELDYKTLLIDADLRNPSLHRILAADNTTGLSNIAYGEAILAQLTGYPGLDALTCGPLPPNPANCIHTLQRRKIWDHFRNSYDYVIVDAPPAYLSDVAELCSSIRNILFVVSYDRMPLWWTKERLALLPKYTNGFVGAVFTQRPVKGSARYSPFYAYSYSYAYAYGPKSSKAGTV